MNKCLTTAAAILFAMILSACGKENQTESPAKTEQTNQPLPTPTASTPSPAPTPAPEPPAPRHNYSLNQNGTYGYEPALSEDDIRQGRATKALLMVRYVGLREGNYILLIIDQNNDAVATRVTCQSPCEFAQSQVISNNYVLKTETVRVTPNSLLGAMVEDAMAGQLTPYGSRQGGSATSAAQTPPQASSQASNSQGGASQQGEASDQLQQASFDCTRAKSIPEYLICHDPELAASDRELAVIFQQAKSAVEDKNAFAERARKQWNYREKNCRDKDCLVAWYEYQKDVLTKIAKSGDVNAQ